MGDQTPDELRSSRRHAWQHGACSMLDSLEVLRIIGDQLTVQSLGINPSSLPHGTVSSSRRAFSVTGVVSQPPKVHIMRAIRYEPT